MTRIYTLRPARPVLLNDLHRTMLITNMMQQLFRLLIFLIQPYMFRAKNSPILRSTFFAVYTAFGSMHRHCFWPVPPGTVPAAPVGSSVDALYQELYIQSKKCSWGWANLSPETCRAELKRSINEKVVASCWLFTSLY